MSISHRWRPTRSRIIRASAVCLAAMGLAACGDAATRSTSRFCGELEAHATEIQTAPTESDDVPQLITLYSKMGEVAPLDVQRDWEKVYGVLKTASTVKPGDAASEQAVADAAYAANQAAENVVAWAAKNCEVPIGPVGIVPGGVEPEVTTTTVLPAG